MMPRKHSCPFAEKISIVLSIWFDVIFVGLEVGQTVKGNICQIQLRGEIHCTTVQQYPHIDALRNHALSLLREKKGTFCLLPPPYRLYKELWFNCSCNSLFHTAFSSD